MDKSPATVHFSPMERECPKGAGHHETVLGHKNWDISAFNGAIRGVMSLCSVIGFPLQ